MTTKVSVLTVTPEMASKWLSENMYEYQRSTRPIHVKFLAEEMKREAFKQDTTIEFCSNESGRVLTDGQHRLSALVQAGIAQRFVVVEKDQMNDSQIALDYTRTDKGTRRTTADDYRVLLLEEELGLTSTQLNKFGSAVALINTGFSAVAAKKLHTDDRLRMMREYNDAYGAFLEVAAGCPREMRFRIERAATLAVSLVTFRYSSTLFGDKVHKFWNGAIWDDGLKLGDARKVANRHLSETGMSGGAPGLSNRRISSAAYSCRFLANCFNAFVEDRQLSHTKIYDASKPIVILGSPFNGK